MQINNYNHLSLSPGQQDLWLEQQLYPQDISNHFHFVSKINEALDTDALQKAIWRLAERHEIIRTVFPVLNGAPVRQLILAMDVSLQVQEPACLSEEELKLLIQRNFEKSFDLTYEIPYRFFLYKRSTSEYYFQLVEHHIATTLKSHSYLLSELAKLYTTELGRQSLHFPEPRITYSHFVEQYHKYFQSDKCKADKDYWAHYLSGSLPSPMLPLHQSLDSVQIANKAYHCDADHELITNLKNIAHSNKSTFFSLMTAAFQALQNSYTKQEEIVIGIPNDVSRSLADRKDLQGFIGYTINTLPLRSKISSEQKFSHFAKKVSDDIRNMSEHRLYPITAILDDLRAEKGNKQDKLFRVLVISQKMEEDQAFVLFGVEEKGVVANIGEFEYESVGIGHLPTGRFDLVLAIVETSNKTVLSWHYNALVFNEEEIYRLSLNYLSILGSIAKDSHKKIGELSVVSKEEQYLQLHEWNHTDSAIKQQKSFLEYFEENASLTPKVPAVVFGGRELSYETLNRSSNQLARYLQKLGVSEKTLVGVKVERSLELIISILGIIKAGGAYLPLDPEHPKERIQFILENAQAELIITQQSLLTTFHNYSGKTIVVDKDWDKISTEDTQNLSINSDSEQLIYVIYTSGSTGKPKGVEIAKKSLDNLLDSMQKQLNLTSSDRWLASTTISFDISQLEILLPLRRGATVVLANQEMVKDPSLLTQSLANDNITFAQATPSTWQMLIDSGWAGSQNLTVLCGGEALSQTLAEKLLTLSPILWNMYGPTETTIWSSIKKIENSKEKITIGRPIANTIFYILDKNRKIQPIGVPGELYIGGVGLARGYRKNPELSKEYFVPSNYAGPIYDKLYKTGDLACYLPNGEIECLGRIDRQAKIRGYRIELGEIEETLKKCAGIQQAVVVIHQDKFGDKRIVAYCTGLYHEYEIKQILSSQLPHYMLPAAYVHLTQFPITPNGKIDQNALPTPKFGLVDFDYEPPRNAIEREIVKIFGSLLDIENVSINSSFFSLGGHSLLAARAITQINRIFHIKLPLKIILEKSTVLLITKEVEVALRGYETSPIYSVPKEKSSGLSYPQQRFWFLEQQTKNSAAYSIPFLIEFTGNLDILALQQAVSKIVERHDILRTIFKEGVDGPEQFSLANTSSFIIYKELSNEKDLNNLVSEESAKPFDLTTGPLFRFILMSLQKNRHLFFLNFHHIIFDGCSINVFVEELKALYVSYVEKKRNALPPLHIQYIDYVKWQNNPLGDLSEKEQISWWVEKLHDTPSFLNLPTDKPRPPIQTYNGALLEFSILDPADLVALKKLSQKHESTLFTTLLAVFHVFLYRYTGQNDLIIGIPVAGRSHSDLDPLIGCFINTLALRTISDSKNTFIDLLKWIRKESVEALKNQDVPFEKMVENLKVERSLSHSLLFQVMFNMLPQVEASNIKGLQIKLKNVDRKMAHLDLSLSVQECEEGLIGVFEYNTDLFFKNTIMRMAKHFQKLVKAVIRNPEESIGKLPLLSKAELHRQVVQWNEQPISYPKNENIIHLIEKWAELLPDSVAVVCKGESYSYREINNQANKIAHTLIKSGIQPEDKVCVCFERSAEFISTILGVLKAGGVYVPLDPNSPKERIESILRELQPFYILTHSSLESRFLESNTLCVDKITISKSDNPLTIIPRKQLAYIIYTSGSTGKPKGVEIEHRSINDRVSWKNSAYPLNPSDVMLHTYSFIFDGAIINYFWPLCAGASLVIASDKEQLDPIALTQLIRKHKVTTMDLLPSLLQGLLDEPEISHCHSLKNVFSGGEALPGEAIHEFYEKCTAKLHNTYGPTEATVEASVWECDPKYVGPIAPIGKPIAGAKLYVLDQDKNCVPIGVPGELHIGGVGLARGYFNSPSLTSEKFIQDMFSNKPKDRLYRTGDLVKYRQDGNIEFLGRIDNQIKIRGFRVDLREVESALMQINALEKAVVAVKGEGLLKHLVAYVVTLVPVDEKVLYKLMKASLETLLPAYMIPQQVVILSQFPTLLNGKINYKALPAPNRKANDPAVSSRKKCKNKMERQLHSIWKDLLRYEELTVADNFFEIGGNSLLAMRMMAKIKNKIGIAIPLVQLFQHPTIKEFAKILNYPDIKKPSSPVILMKDGGDKKPFFCVHPVGGNVLCYRALAKYWADDRPFYAIQAPGLEAGETPYYSIEEMATAYIKSIREIQPYGPYILGGWSFGGLVAVEMANQLLKLGEKISLLALIDTTANIEKFKTIDIADESLLLSELTHHFTAKSSAQKGNLSFKEQFVRFIENGGRTAVKQEHSSIDRLIALAKSNYRALQAFSIPSIDTKIVLIRTQANPEKTKSLGWNKYTKKLKIFHAPGNHWAITQDDQADHYSQILQKCFASLEKETNLSVV